MTDLCGVSHGQMAKVELERLSEKSQRRSQRSPIGSRKVPFGPFHAPYSGQIHAWSVIRTPFPTVSEGVFSEGRIPNPGCSFSTLTPICAKSPRIRSDLQAPCYFDG